MGEPEHISTILARVIEDVADLQTVADDWRRRNLILDSQIERMGYFVAELRALAETYEHVLKQLPDGPWLEQKLTHLLEAIIKEDKSLKGAIQDAERHELGELFGEKAGPSQ